MQREFTVVIHRTEDGYVAFCPEVPGANGQGDTREEVLEDLKAAIELMLEVYRDDALEQVGKGAETTTVMIG